MALHDRYFLEELYTEHLEEAAFQYETRLNWLHDDEVAWQDLDQLDDTMEAHIDALVVGEAQALKVCIESLAEAEATVLHVIVRVFCRHRLIDRLALLWKDFDFADDEKVSAVADALKWECPKEWFVNLLKVFAGDKKEMFPVLAPCVATRSPDAGDALLVALEKAGDEQTAMLISNIGRCTFKQQDKAIAVLAPFARKDDNDIVTESMTALMIQGEGRCLNACADKIHELPLVFAIGGSVAHSRKFISHASEGLADADCILAMGMSGNLEAIPQLLAYLKHPDFAPQAAQALQLMTAANLFDSEHVAEEVDEDELFESEIEAYKNGELPKNIDGNPFGVEIEKISIDHDRWFSWLQSNKGSFAKGQRYRNGQLYSPKELLNNIIHNQTPYKLREYAYLELAIRYGVPLPFFADDLVLHQQSNINEIYTWVQNSGNLFTPGQWYFAGREIPA